MNEQLEQLITLFLEINRRPSDEQFHQLACACGVDPETLEAVAYKMLADLHDQDDDETVLIADGHDDTYIADALGLEDEEGFDDPDQQEGLAAAMTPGVDDDTLTPEDRVLSTPNSNTGYLGYQYVALTDGSTNPRNSAETQEDTKDDGTFVEFDQGATNDDGPVMPSLIKRISSRLRASNAPRATFILKDPDLLEVPSASDKKVWAQRDGRGKFEFLNKMSNIAGSGVSLKIGTGQFNQKVEFNSIYKKPTTKFDYKIGKRRGYTVIEVTLS